MKTLNSRHLTAHLRSGIDRDDY